MDKVSSHLVDGSLTLEERSQSAIITMLSLLSPFGILIIFFIFWFLFMGNSQGNAGNKTMSFGKSRARMMGTGEKTRVTFDDVAGVDEEKVVPCTGTFLILHRPTHTLIKFFQIAFVML